MVGEKSIRIRKFCFSLGLDIQSKKQLVTNFLPFIYDLLHNKEGLVSKLEQNKIGTVSKGNIRP
jgi:hypothetical protein